MDFSLGRVVFFVIIDAILRAVIIVIPINYIDIK